MFDLVLLAIIGISALLGLMRGFVGIVVGAASWLLSGWAALQFGGAAGKRPRLSVVRQIDCCHFFR